VTTQFALHRKAKQAAEKLEKHGCCRLLSGFAEKRETADPAAAEAGSKSRKELRRWPEGQLYPSFDVQRVFQQPVKPEFLGACSWRC
jgi:hypothetical protein